MKLKKYIFTVLLSGATLAAAATPSPAHTNPANLSQYVGIKSQPYGAPTMTFLPDGKSYAALSPDGRKIERIDLVSGKSIETMFEITNTRETKLDHIEGFTFSDNGERIMVWTNTRPLYRRSMFASYYIYEVRSRLLKPLSENHSLQRSPIFSPDGLAVAFVAEDNNIYLKKLTYGTEVAVTKDGEINKVINGVPDWVYEEEFTTSCSMTWSPDSRTLCFLRYDESAVPSYTLQLYSGVCNDYPQYFLYPGEFTYKYPVAGKQNSTVTIHSYDIDNRTLKQLNLPSGSSAEYIPRLEFAHANDRLMIVTLNRAQTRMEIFSANPRSLVARSIMVEQQSAWLNPETYENISWEPESFVILSGRTGYDHLYRYSYNGSLTTTITSGNYDVTEYYGTDQQGNAYLQSTLTGSINRVINKVDRKGTITSLTPTDGTASARFTTGHSYYLLNYSNATTPPVISLCTAPSGKAVRIIADNTKGEYAQRFATSPKREFFTIKSEEVELNAYMIKPTDFDSSHRYPVIMSQYSGPGSQQVCNIWQMNWENYFATQGYIIVCVDGRGTGYRGRAFMDAVYRQLGHYETIDQVNAARHIASLPYVDSNRIGIHGWSFGGYETLMAASAPNAPYAAAVAVAPVTDWRFYDTIYAERYMLTPQENEDGYFNSAPLNFTKDVKCPLLIMSGTADDNVHPANTTEYIGKMISEGNYCDQLMFPNMNHSINGCGTRALVYARMLDYFNANMR